MIFSEQRGPHAAGLVNALIFHDNHGTRAGNASSLSKRPMISGDRSYRMQISPCYDSRYKQKVSRAKSG
jgi:hypothetical protein